MCYWEDVTCVLWSCRYSRAVIRSCLPAWEKASWGERTEKWRRAGERETTDKIQHQENITAICFIFLKKKKYYDKKYFMIMLCFAKLHHLRKRGYAHWRMSDLNVDASYAIKKALSAALSATTPHSFLMVVKFNISSWWKWLMKNEE